MKLIKIQLFTIIISLCLIFPHSIYAAPYFYLSDDGAAVYGVDETVSIRLTTDSQTLTSAHTIVNFDSDALEPKSISILSSRCSFWAPADPALGYGNTVAPYFYGGNKAVLSCGFSNPGYVTSSGSSGALIAKLTFTPVATTSSVLSFTAASTKFYYIGNSIAAGAMEDFTLTTYVSTASAEEAIAIAATASSTTTTSSYTTLTDSDLTFVEIGTGNVSQTSGSDDVTLQIIEEDDTIPAPGYLDPRPKPSPFSFGFGGGEGGGFGSILSAQSLRELLIPGKSDADKRVVLFNLISLLAFLVLLAILIWRFITLKRTNQLKAQHLSELLSSELSVMATKLSGVGKGEAADKIKQELDESIQKYSEQLKPK